MPLSGTVMSCHYITFSDRLRLAGRAGGSSVGRDIEVDVDTGRPMVNSNSRLGLKVGQAAYNLPDSAALMSEVGKVGCAVDPAGNLAPQGQVQLVPVSSDLKLLSNKPMLPNVDEGSPDLIVPMCYGPDTATPPRRPRRTGNA